VGVIMRTVSVWYITWSVNSLTHTSGYRNYETNDRSRNNWLVAFLAANESCHNNHHAQPRCAAAGHHWCELVRPVEDAASEDAASEDANREDANREETDRNATDGERTADSAEELRRAA
jgi:hypothetical protein